MDDRAVDQYLQRHAQDDAHTPWPFAQRRFDYVVVVPAFAERPDFIEHALREHAASSVLLIVVANAPVNAQAAEIEKTRALLTCAAPQPLHREALGADVIWHAEAVPFAVLIVDRVGDGQRLPTDEGVGLARKTGMDRALAAIALGNLRTHTIYCGDADAQWPANYFTANLTSGDSAVTFAFKHVGPHATAPAQRAYDLRIRDYPASLTAAGSRYGFQALGSAVAISATHYAQVRGCPRRAAGEDFHLLAKLSKLGRIRHCPHICVAIRSRLSQRVPFGTGPAVARLQTLDDPFAEPLFYCEQSYQLLRTFLVLVAELLAGDRTALARPALTLRLENLLAIDPRPGLSSQVFEPAQLTQALTRAFDASSNIEQRRRQFTTWFDALRTLQFMHRLRDAGLTNIDAHTLRAEQPTRYARALQP